MTEQKKLLQWQPHAGHSLEELEKAHAALEGLIQSSGLAPCQLRISEIKRAKLRIKEEINRRMKPAQSNQLPNLRQSQQPCCELPMNRQDIGDKAGTIPMQKNIRVGEAQAA